jgi:hypothetical protein
MVVHACIHPFNSLYVLAFRGGSTGGWGAPAPYSWCIDGNMDRVREKKRWMKEEKWREREKEEETSPLSPHESSAIGA